MVEACVAGTTTYTCRCKEGYTVQLIRANSQCFPVGGTDKQKADEQERQESTGGYSTAAIAGGVVGGLALLGIVAAGISNSRNRGYANDDDSQLPPHLARPGMRPSLEAMDDRAWASSPSLVPPPGARPPSNSIWG